MSNNTSLRTRVNNVEFALNEIHDEFYISHRKKIFFTSEQKLECAKNACCYFDLCNLLASTCYIIYGSNNRVFFDYGIFKMYANPLNYANIVNHVASILDISMLHETGYEFHIDLSSFTISAAERYKPVIDAFCNICLSRSNDNGYSNSLINIHIYNTPIMMETISCMLSRIIPSNVRSRVILHTKAESIELLAGMFTAK
jgi:hypothetical protein